MLLSGRAVVWFIGGECWLLPFVVGEKRVDAFGPVPVRGSGGPVECCLPLVPGHVTDPFGCCPFGHAGGAVVRFGRVAERLGAGSQHFGGGSVCLGGVALGRCQPLAGGNGPSGYGSGFLSRSAFSRARTASSRASISC